MRRLWAYILTAAASIVTVATVFPTFVKQTQTNAEYTSGKELVFRVTENDDEDSKQVLDDKVAVNEIADVMRTRLDTAGISRYKVNVEGNDRVRVGFYQSSDEEYNNVARYLSFNGSLAITAKYDKEHPENFKSLTSEQFRTDEKAYRGTKTYESNNVPVFVLPVKNDTEEWKDLIEEAKKHEVTVSEADEESGTEAQTASFIYLWYNFSNHPETDYSFWDVDNEDAKNNYFLTQFVITQNGEEKKEDTYLTTDEGENRLFSYNQDALSSDPTTKRKGYNTLDLMVNLLNAEKLNYKVTMTHTIQEASPWVESLVTYTGTSRVMAMNKTVIATICAVLIISLLLAIFFRVGAVSIVTSTLVSTLLAYGSMLLLSAEYTTLTLFALVAVAFASIASGIIYCGKLKSECYKGRTLKKANADASRKSILPIVDIHVALAIVSIFIYIFGGAIVRSFAVVTFLGALASLLINLLLLRGMMWLATNTTALQGKYNLFGMDPAKIPDPMKEEKQTYYGEYADKDLTKKKKPFAIATVVITLASLVGAIIFSSIPRENGGGTYRKKETAVASRIYFETTKKDSDDLTEEKLNAILDKVILYEGTYDASKEYKNTLKTHVKNYEFNNDEPYTIYYTYIPEGNEEGDNTKVFYSVVVNLDSAIAENTKALFKGYEAECAEEKYEINDIFFYFADEISTDANLSISFKAGTQASTGEVNVGKIALGTGVALLVIGLYLIIRYRLSRGLAATIVTGAVGITTFGIFSLTRLAVTNYVAAVTPLAVLFTFIVAIIVLNKEREMVLDSKSKELTLEDREALMKRATGISFSTVMIVAIMCVYLAVNFFGFGNISVAMPFALLTIMCIAGCAAVVVLVGPLACKLAKGFSKIKLPERKHKKKANAVVKKSAEPEEAIFPGIND